MAKSAFLAALTAACFTSGGCVHNMQVRNLDEFQLTAHTAKRHTLRLTAATAGPTQPYAVMIRDGLVKHPSIAQVALASEPTYDSKPDADVQADVTVKYEGSGANLPITFPGFLLFAHAWNGFVYKADIVTNLTVTLAATGETRTRTLKTRYDMRHCDFGRGFWASSGWFLPGLGGTSLLAGFFMMSYDTDATPRFSTAVHDAYGAFVANNIAQLLSEEEAQPHARLKTNEAMPATVPAVRVSATPVAGKKRANSLPAPPSPAKPVVAVQETKPVPPPPKSEDDAYNDRIRKEQAAFGQ